jgi:drug/metabolite transporter (DMT)-like permease
MRHLALLPFGLFACSTSIIFIKESQLHPVLLAALRLLVATIVLLPLFIRDLRRHWDDYGRAEFARSSLAGLMLALHFVSWNYGARMTPAVNSTLLVNMVPLATPFLLLAFVRERVTRRESVATVTSVLGLLLLMGRDYNLSTGHLAGDLTCFGSMLLFAVYLVLGRRNRDVATLWLYLVPLYGVAGLLCLGGALLTVDLGAQPWNPRELGLAAGLGLIPGVLGHSILNNAVKHLRGQLVSVANLSQVLFAGLLAYLLLGEVPDAVFYPSAALIIAGAVLAITGPPAGAR